jgi:iron complex outermembrane receptor protein
MGFNSTIASVEPTVGLFLDGIYIGANLGGLADTFDVESVEVLRGPQGTLFGRNVTGGAVLMRSRRPTGTFGGKARIGAGSGGRFLVSASIEDGLTDTLSGKIYGHYDRMSGDFDNQATGGKHGRNKNLFFRPMLRWEPTSAIDITLIGEYGKTDGDGVNNRLVENPDELIYTLGGRGPTGGADKLNINYDGYTHVEWGQVVLDANWDVGPGTITSISGYRKVDYSSAGDTDGSQIELARASNAMDQHQFSEELRYAGKAFDDRLDFTVGAYYFEQKLSQKYHVIFFGTSNQRSAGEISHHAASVFAQGDFEFARDFFLTVGARTFSPTPVGLRGSAAAATTFAPPERPNPLARTTRKSSRRSRPASRPSSSIDAPN